MSDFEVYVDLGSDVSVKFTLSEEELLEHRDPHIKAIAHSADRSDEPAERRTAVRTAAYERVRRMIVTNVTEPVSVVDGNTVWVIPTHAIRAARLRDPDTGENPRPFGFVKRPDD
jgi:hypothetical protein